MTKPKYLGQYKTKSIYFDTHGSKDSVYISSGPVKEVNPPGLIYVDYENNKITKENGEQWIPEKVDYEIKFFLVGNERLKDAINSIQIIEDSDRFKKRYGTL